MTSREALILATPFLGADHSRARLENAVHHHPEVVGDTYAVGGLLTGASCWTEAEGQQFGWIFAIHTALRGPHSEWCQDRSVSRFDVEPRESQVWVDGSSSVHAIHATASGVTGWIELGLSDGGVARASRLAGEVRVAVDRLASGNALVDRETKRRIDATRYPEIVGTVTAAERIDSERFAVTGDLAFRGEVRSVSGEVVVSLKGKNLIVEGTQTFDVRTWGLRLPRIGFLRVHPDVRVRIRAVANLVD